MATLTQSLQEISGNILVEKLDSSQLSVSSERNPSSPYTTTGQAFSFQGQAENDVTNLSSMVLKHGVAQHHETLFLEEQCRDVDDNIPSGHDTNLPPLEWPYNGRYFVSEVMDAEAAYNLLNFDAEFQAPDCQASENFTVLDITNVGSRSYALLPSDIHFDSKMRMSDLGHGDARIGFISQKRRHFNNSTSTSYGTKCVYGIKFSTWLRILSLGEIPPNILEVLHENNGGWGVHISGCADTKGRCCGMIDTSQSRGSSLCAYHIWVKPRPWWRQERFLYARYDFHSGQKFILITGNSLDGQIKRLSSRFRPPVQPHLFSTLLAIVTGWTKELEKFLWERDFVTQQLESDTGWSIVSCTQMNPLPPEKLALRRDMAMTKELLNTVARASESYSKLFIFLSREISSIPLPDLEPSYLLDQLKVAFLQQDCRQWHQKIQANALMARIDAQWNIVNALIAQHNNGLNNQIANDSRTDTTIMRRISFVTLVFLPATFLATFFSMSFFHITSGSLVVSPTIWIYVACMIPVTLIVAWQSSSLGSSQLQWLTTKASKMWKSRSKIPMDEILGEGQNNHAHRGKEAQQMA